MKSLRLCLALGVLLVLPRAAAAQTPGEGSGAGAFIQLPNGDWVPKDHPAAAVKPPFPLHGYIDAPAPLAKADYFVGFPITGWMLDCRNGQQPPFVAVLVQDVGWITRYSVERALPRPDVRDQFAGPCPNIGTNAAFGYTVRVNEPLPPGNYWLTVFWNDGADKSRAESRFVIVKP